jgi:hypothetical protein
MSWSEAVKFCGLLKKSHTAQSLYLKAKAGKRLTPRQVFWVFKYSEIAKARWGSTNIEVLGKFSFPVHNKNGRLTFIFRNGWIVELVSAKVVGRVLTDRVVLYPNGIIHPLDLKKLLLCTV